MIKAGIIGSTGYAGVELVRLLTQHKEAEVVWYGSRSYIDKKYYEVFQNMFQIVDDKCLDDNMDELAKQVDVIFTATPQGLCASLVNEDILSKVKIIDLSADFRIKDVSVYEKWYGIEHKSPQFIDEAVYGLCEINRDKVKNARLIANPGCYPTTILLGTAPAIKNGLVKSEGIIIDSKSGVSGSGRKGVKAYYETEAPTARAYKVGGKHRHIPEIEQELSNMFGKSVTITFTPQIIPMERGMLSCIYMDLAKKITIAEITDLYKNFYKGRKFVRVLDEGKLPSIKNVVETNYLEIGFGIDERTNKLIIISAQDNLVKGASGQAVQNMNIMFGLPEETGLEKLQ